MLKMIFLFPRWDMLIPWRVLLSASSEREWTTDPSGWCLYIICHGDLSLQLSQDIPWDDANQMVCRDLWHALQDLQRLATQETSDSWGHMVPWGFPWFPSPRFGTRWRGRAEKNQHRVVKFHSVDAIYIYTYLYCFCIVTRCTWNMHTVGMIYIYLHIYIFTYIYLHIYIYIYVYISYCALIHFSMLWHTDWRFLFKLNCIHRWRNGLNFRRGKCPFRGACFQAYYSKLIAKESTATELCAGRLMGNFILFSDSYVPVQSGTAFYRAIQMDAGKGTFFSLGGDVNCLFYKPVAWSNLGIFVRTVTGTWNVCGSYVQGVEGVEGSGIGICFL